ncbi:hypothetical protein F8N00_11725 [Exiguobacterium sp. A1_3_1]|uniref:hypothetical protein n=1 Tax=unclassified Exiguobacterium TaxID=2644629 RepID=UPI001BE813A9|nr:MULTISPECIES: hypothetical protein [unclassified Exiguobacterium]
MRKLIIFHQNNYNPKTKERFKTKEFLFSILLLCGFLVSILLIPLLSNYFVLLVSWILPAGFAIGTYRYFNYLERETDFFVNKNEEYKIALKKQLNEESIVNSAQLDVLIKTLTEERDGNQKQLGVAFPFVVLGVTLISTLSNKGQVTNETLALYFVIYFFAALVIHAILKICEPFFNLYADRVATLISFLREIQIEWLNDRSRETVTILDQEERKNDKKLSVEIESAMTKTSPVDTKETNPLV